LLVEKPIADTLENADMIIKAAHDAKVKLMVGISRDLIPPS